MLFRSNGGANVTDYLIQKAVATNTLVWTTVTDTVSTTTTLVVSGLNNGTAYRFRVAAINAAGTGAYVTTTNSVTPTNPNP